VGRSRHESIGPRKEEHPLYETRQIVSAVLDVGHGVGSPKQLSRRFRQYGRLLPIPVPPLVGRCVCFLAIWRRHKRLPPATIFPKKMKFICEEIRELSSGIQLMEDDIAILRDNVAAADSNLTQQLKRRRRNVAKGKERTRTLERTANIEYWYQRSSLRWGA
jgi:hypothetical protein